MPQDYNKTLNLPQTDFPMRAGLPAREPEMLKGFEEAQVYKKLMRHNANKPLFVLHDGPPFSNGDIHIGTAMNKIIKDIIVRYKNMSGFKSPYIPGWDNHGMPIESAIIKKNKLDRKSMSITQFRNACRDFAADFVQRQMGQFKRLGVIGDWEKPYLTMDTEFEGIEVKVFGEMYRKGYIYKGMKPVYWCPHDETALAEAEIEYADVPCTSIYVKFPVTDDRGLLSKYAPLDKMYFVIWTTTTWTLPGNLAISLNPKFEYALMKTESGEVYIVAAELAEAVAKAAKLENYEILAKLKGSDLEYMKAAHPFLDRKSTIIVGEHVTLEAGTGCVHTAPGFGLDDFNVCRKYPEIGMTVPVNDRGIMTAEAGPYEGQYYEKANDAILEDLKIAGLLLASEKIKHSYPHCWRCKHPIIFRATEQWFASVDSIKDAAVKSCDDIKWLPEWGYERMVAMIRERSDWCISRQRNWGLPIPVFYCETCEKPVCTPKSIDIVAKLFTEKGSNAWFEEEAADILGKDFSCPHCGAKTFTKETDTLDGWFDSGSTHAAVCKARPELQFPADIYLEGGDQYRGWFQSSMLTSIAVNGKAPYKIIITHGWTVDGEGRAMHKSLGNAIAPEEIIKDYGADLLRLWVSSSDYHQDVRISKDIFKQLSDIYLKIRNTARFILGNLEGFDPDNQVPTSELCAIDRWALTRLNVLTERVRNSYENYEFHPIYHAIHNFCVIDMSNQYLDIIKDRLYCEDKNGILRRSAQTAMYQILDALVRMLAPILAFTAEEIWSSMPHGKNAEAESVLFNEIPTPNKEYDFGEEEARRWEELFALRAEVLRALEKARAEKVVGKSLDASLTLYVGEKTGEVFKKFSAAELAELFIVSEVKLAETEGEGYKSTELDGLTISVAAAETEKCARCWTHHGAVGENAEHPELCPRCAAVVSRMPV
jgi:isoleucyl-tRNA synthetase